MYFFSSDFCIWIEFLLLLLLHGLHVFNEHKLSSTEETLVKHRRNIQSEWKEKRKTILFFNNFIYSSLFQHFWIFYICFFFLSSHHLPVKFSQLLHTIYNFFSFFSSTTIQKYFQEYNFPTFRFIFFSFNCIINFSLREKNNPVSSSSLRQFYLHKLISFL